MTPLYVLSKKLKKFLNDFKPVLDATNDAIGGFAVNEVELNLEISGEGGVKLVGTLTAGVKAGVTIKLAREKKP